MVRATWLWCRRSSRGREFKPKSGPSAGLGNSLRQPGIKWEPVSNLGRIKKRKEKEGLYLVISLIEISDITKSNVISKKVRLSDFSKTKINNRTKSIYGITKSQLFCVLINLIL